MAMVIPSFPKMKQCLKVAGRSSIAGYGEGIMALAHAYQQASLIGWLPSTSLLSHRGPPF